MWPARAENRVSIASLTSNIAGAFQHEGMKVRSHWLCTELPNHHGDLTSVVGGMISHVLHQVRQSDLRGAKREQFYQRFIVQAIYEFFLFLLDLHPFEA